MSRNVFELIKKMAFKLCLVSTRSILLVIVSASFAWAGTNNALMYQGRIVRPDGNPVNSGAVTFTLTVYSPSPGHCLLYSETQIVGMTGSQGMFSLALGTGVRTDSGSHSFRDVFVNGILLSGLACSSGTSYTGGSLDDRELVVSFNDAGTIVNLSTMSIKSVPFALQAHEIDGWGVNNLVKVSSIGSPTTFTASEMARVKGMSGAACATNEILKWNGSAWACSSDATGAAPGDAAYTGTKGVLAFDTDAATSGISVSSGIAKLSSTGVTAGTYGTASKVSSFAVNAQGRITSASEIAISIPSTQITGGSASTGDVLKWNGSAWLPAADNTGTSPGDATYSSKGLIQADTDAATSGLNLSSGVISVNSGTAANQIVKLDASAKLPSVDGSQLTNLSTSQLSAGTLPVSKGGTGSAAALTNNKVMVSSGGAIVEGNGFGSSKAANTFVTRDASGNFAAGVGTFDSLKLNGSTSGTLTLTVPSSFASFSLNLPSADGSAGQFLKTDGSGNLTWATVAGAPGDSTYSAKGIVQFNTDAATSGISLSSGVATVNYGTGANQIVKLDAASKLPAVDGSALTNLSANNISSGTLPISRGGTGASTKTSAFDALSPNSAKGDITVHNGTNNISLPRGSDGQVLMTDSAQASGLKWANANAGTVTSVTGGTGLTGGTITTAGTLNVDVGTGANQIVQMTAASKLPAVDGSLLTNLSTSQISSGTLPVLRGGTGASSFTGDSLVGTNTTGTALQSVTCAQNQVLSFDASGKYGCYNLSSIAGGTYFANGGNSFAGAATLGTNDNNTLALKTNNTVRMTLDTAGNVGIGTASPGAPLDVKGEIRMSGATSGYAGLKSPAAGPSVTWTLPTGDGSAGQFLKTDGSGNLSWTSASSVAITSINGSTVTGQSFAVPGTSGTAPAWSTNTGTGVHTLNIPMASTASVTAGLISKTDYDTFNNKLGTSTSFSGDMSGSYNATSVDKIKSAPLSISTLSSGNFLKYNGSAWVNTSLASADITGALGYTPVNRAGDTLSGALNLGGFDIKNTGNIEMASSKNFLISNNASDPAGLTAADKGRFWFNSSTNQLKYYDGSSIQALGVAGAGITNFNGSTVSSQSFATPGTSGTAPSWSTSAGTGVHSLNIPMASTASVTAGLISKTDYDTFNNKLGTSTSFSGDVSGTYNATSVDKIKGASLSISSLSSGNFLKYNGSAWVNTNLVSADIPSLDASILTTGTLPISRGGTGVSSLAANRLVGTNGTGTAQQAVSCALNQVISFDASGNYGCYNLSSIAAGTYFAQGGNSFGANATLGTNDNYTLGFQTNGTVRITLDGNGNLGVGTASPGGIIHTSSETNAKIYVDNYGTASNPAIVGRMARGTTAAPTAIQKDDDLMYVGGRGYGATGFSSTSVAGIGMIAAENFTDSSQGSLLIFETTPIGSTSRTERMRIEANGSVGIGTMAPTSPGSTKFRVVDSNFTEPMAIFESACSGCGVGPTIYNNISQPGSTADVNFAVGSGYLQWVGSVSGVRYNNNVDGGLVFKTAQNGNGYERMRIDNNGYLGIGTTAPGAPLDVKGEIRMTGATSGYAGLKSPATGPSVTWTLPTADGSAGQFLKTDGSGNLSWASASTAAITSLNGLTAATQTFAIGTSGNSPNFSSATATHTLNIPMASTASVTAGLISKTDYDAFNTKLGTSTSFSGDVSGTYNATSVDKIKAAPLTIGSLSSGNYLKYNGSAWVNASLGSSDITGALGYTPVNKAGDTMSGALNMNGSNVSNVGTLSLKGSTSGTLSMTVPATVTSYTLNWPAAVGSANQVLSTDASGNLSWATVPSASSTFINNGNSFGVATTLGTNDNQALNFETYGTTRMTIDTTGKIGIGTASPTNLLHLNVNQNSATSILIENTTNAAASAAVLTVKSDATNGSVQMSSSSSMLANFQNRMQVTTGSNGIDMVASNASGDIRFYTGGLSTAEERMRVTSAGKVGIGTNNPGAPLDVKGEIRMSGTTSGYAGFKSPAAGPSVTWTLPTADGSAGQFLKTDGAGNLSWATAGGSGFVNGGNIFGGNATLGTLDNYALGFKTNNSTRMTILNDGKVGIGTTAPDISLYIQGQGNGDGLKINGTSNCASSACDNVGITIANNGTGGKAWSFDATGNSSGFGQGNLVFAEGGLQGGAARLTLETGGNVGIGTSDPTTTLDVRSDLGAAPSAGASNVLIANPTPTGHVVRLGFDGGNTVFPTALIESGGGNFDGYLAFLTRSPSNGHVEVARFDSSGFLGIGTSAPRSALDVNGTITAKAAVSNAGSPIDFGTGNLQYTTASCGAFALYNMKDGGTYSLLIEGTTSATCSFTAYTDSGTTALTVHLPPDNGATIAGKFTLYSFTVFGSHVITAWTPGY